MSIFHGQRLEWKLFYFKITKWRCMSLLCSLLINISRLLLLFTYCIPINSFSIPPSRLAGWKDVPRYKSQPATTLINRIHLLAVIQGSEYSKLSPGIYLQSVEAIDVYRGIYERSTLREPLWRLLTEKFRFIMRFIRGSPPVIRVDAVLMHHSVIFTCPFHG